jgi:hypothetical protein
MRDSLSKSAKLESRAGLPSLSSMQVLLLGALRAGARKKFQKNRRQTVKQRF